MEIGCGVRGYTLFSSGSKNTFQSQCDTSAREMMRTGMDTQLWGLFGRQAGTTACKELFQLKKHVKDDLYTVQYNLGDLLKYVVFSYILLFHIIVLRGFF